ncbi:MAG: bifunctional 4-hydroxy-2-oxoglutarate aldolase/2-dehydro-3-deoxy-phosphogluconate aldolase [Armatimonadota bacterium]|nr:bifunctional 4-hydroxy-2-oxoglutarate aldolase/2-dehydro-3-deoxy-phosphogluconate aldolase [Armatimonadota bacterium]MDR7536895.1 bifunctional 4-hydroxy-2-oxoglutarate aldolase/2-dehydro-3-deoxy-phosphogluconate aldolase [Armatimonadota bacterium]
MTAVADASAARAIAAQVLDARLIAILRRLRSPEVEPIVETLLAAGVRVVEITFETAGGAETLRALREAFGGAAILGAGSLLEARQAEDAVDAGAQFLVSPGLVEDVSQVARAHDRLYIPGVLTATEVGVALRWGHAIQKLFPAGLLGPEYLRALQAPYPEVRFLAVGNIGPDDVATYLRAGAAGVAMGSQLVGHGVALDVLAARAREAMAQVRAVASA